MKTTDGAKRGATPNALGDCDMSDLTDGYCKVPDPQPQTQSPFEKQDGGFAGRPSGWAR